MNGATRTIGFVSARTADMLRNDVPVVDVAMTARNAALESQWRYYDESDRGFGTLSSDENRWSRRLMILLAMSPLHRSTARSPAKTWRCVSSCRSALSVAAPAGRHG